MGGSQLLVPPPMLEPRYAHTLRATSCTLACLASLLLDSLTAARNARIHAATAGVVFDDTARARVRGCLTPQRATPQQRAMFFLGDSHAGAMLPGIEASVRGAMALAYTARGMCGYLCTGAARLSNASRTHLERLSPEAALG